MYTLLEFRHIRNRRFLAAALFVSTLTIGGATAATVHRLDVGQSAGSEGATAFVQTSPTGSALQGEVNTAANTALKIPFGLLGEYDMPGSTFGIGVIGLSSTGYAIGAEAFDAQPTIIALAQGDGYGIEAATASSSDTNAYAIYAVAQGGGDGIDGIADANGWGGYFDSTGGIGVEGISFGSQGSNRSSAIYGYQGGSGAAGYFESGGTGNALHAVADSTSGAGVVSDNSIGSRGILGDNSGEAVVGFGHSGNGHAAITAIDAVGGTRLFETQSYNGGSPATSFEIQPNTANRSGQSLLAYGTDAQLSGDLYVYGEIFQNCNNFPAVSSTNCDPVTAGSATTGAVVARSANGNTVAMFGAHQSLPTVEDLGTAEMVNGRALVRLDPAFAQTMATDRAYRVFVTPNGPSRGIYVINRTPQGFEVDENPGGRSTVSFDYRIVATPFGDRSTRLAIVPKKIVRPYVADPSDVGLRAQAAEVRGFDLAKLRTASKAALLRHPHQKVPASFASLSKTKMLHAGP